MSEFTADLESLRQLTVVEGRPTYLLGHSMGGLIALDYALDHQADLKALMLSGALVLLTVQAMKVVHSGYHRIPL